MFHIDIYTYGFYRVRGATLDACKREQSLLKEGKEELVWSHFWLPPLDLLLGSWDVEARGSALFLLEVSSGEVV